MNSAQEPQTLPAIMGSLRQKGEEGELILEQNDGCRRLYWEYGNLVYLRSDVTGEQFGNYLLRQGILDYKALNEILAKDEAGRLGDKVVQWGLMTVQERDTHLYKLQEQIMIHALEHPVIQMQWNPGRIQAHLSEDLQFHLKHRHFVWRTFQEARHLDELVDLLYQQAEWRWVAPANLLESMSDLPLNPQVAYAMSFLGVQPVGYETFISLSGMDEEEAARLLVSLWALGTLNMTQGELPTILRAAPHGESLQDETSWSDKEEIPSPPQDPSPTPLVPKEVLDAREASTPSPPPIGATAPLKTEDPLHTELDMLCAPEDKAASEAEDVEEDPKQRARKLFMRGKGLALRERTIEAIRSLEHGLQLDPDSEITYEPWLILGRLRMANPAWSTRALEALQAATKLRPKAAEPWGLMGELYHRKGFKNNSSACFRKAIELDPSFVLPSGIDLTEAPKEETQEPPERSLFTRIKSIWSKPEKT